MKDILNKVFKRDKPIKAGTRALYKRTNEIVEIVEHKMPKQVTIRLYKTSRAYSEDFKYLPFVQQQFEKDIYQFLHAEAIDVTIGIDMLEVLPDGEIAELLY